MIPLRLYLFPLPALVMALAVPAHAAEALPALPAKLPAGAIASLPLESQTDPYFVSSVAFSPDGKTLATVRGDTMLLLWDAAGGNLVHNEKGDDWSCNTLAFSPNGQMVATGGWAGIIQLWEVAGGKSTRRFQAHDGGINGLAFSSDGKTLASASDDHTVRLWDVAAERELHRLKGHESYVAAVAFSPDGKTVASGGQDRTLRLWDVATGNELHTLRGHDDQVSAVVFARDSQSVISASWDGTIRLWETATGKEIRRLRGHRHDVHAIALAPDGRTLASGGNDGTLRLWDVATGKEARAVPVYPRGQPVAPLPEGKAPVAVQGQSPMVNVLAVAWSPDGKTLATGDDYNDVHLWEAATGKELRVFEGPTRTRRKQTIFAAALSPDGKTLITGGSERSLRLWDTTGTELRQLGKHPGTVWSAAYSPDGKHLASAARRHGVVRLWDTANGQLVRTFPGPRGGVSRVVFSSDGRSVVASGGSFDPTIFRWETASGKELCRFTGHTDYVDGLALAPDGKTLASASRDGTTRLWETATGKELDQLPAAAGGIHCVAFSPDGRLLAGGGVGVVHLWDMPSGRLRRQLHLPQQDNRLNATVAALSFSPDGKVVVSGSIDGRVLLWEVAAGQVRLRLSDLGPVQVVGYSPRGKTLVSGTQNGTAIVWDVFGKGRDGLPWPAEPTARDLDLRWDLLANADAASAYWAVAALAAVPRQAAALLQGRLSPVRLVVDEQRTQQLIKELDDDRFAVRDRATVELEKLGDSVEPALRKALGNRPSLEMRRRLEGLLQKVDQWPPEQLRIARALEVLEHLATPDARRVLETLARGTAEARQTRHAKEALERLARPAAAP